MIYTSNIRVKVLLTECAEGINMLDDVLQAAPVLHHLILIGPMLLIMLHQHHNP